MQRKNRIVLSILSLCALAALMAGLYVSKQWSQSQTKDLGNFQGTLLKEPRKLATFSLQGTDKQVFNNQSLKGQWTYLFFGFTNCGYLCPTTLGELAKMYRLLEIENTSPLPKVVFVSIDPERDTLSKLKQYANAFHPDFYAARGDNAAVAKMTKEMGVMYEKVALPSSDKNAPENNYDMQHTGTIMLFDPQGDLRAFFTTPHDAKVLAKDYHLLLG